MNRTQASRMLTLAYFLKTRVADENFSLKSWCSHGARLAERGEAVEKVLENPPCGTTACAVGYLPTIFRDWKWIKEETKYAFLPYTRPAWIKATEGGHSVQNSKEFFGIDTDEWDRLFGAGNVRSPKEEALELEKFCEEKGWVYG